MKIEFDVIRVLAVGCEKRFMFIKYHGYNNVEYEKCVVINDYIYRDLLKKGVPTSQKLASLRKKNNVG